MTAPAPVSLDRMIARTRKQIADKERRMLIYLAVNGEDKYKPSDLEELDDMRAILAFLEAARAKQKDDMG